jgi:hypothetical protein
VRSDLISDRDSSSDHGEQTIVADEALQQKIAEVARLINFEAMIDPDDPFRNAESLAEKLNIATMTGRPIPLDSRAELTTARLILLGALGELRDKGVAAYQVNGHTFAVADEFFNIVTALKER